MVVAIGYITLWSGITLLDLACIPIVIAVVRPLWSEHALNTHACGWLFEIAAQIVATTLLSMIPFLGQKWVNVGY